MEKKKFIATVVLSILTVILLTTGLCFAEQNKDEQEFKTLIAETNSYFYYTEAVMEKMSPNASEKDMNQQQLALITRLRKFINDYPASVYADDAAYILTLFWSYAPEKYMQEAELFLEKYSKASLEPLTLNTLQILNPFVKEVGVIDAVKTDMTGGLNYLKRYEESSREARAAIDDLNTKTLSPKGYRLLGLNYLYLVKDYQALAKNEEARKVCNEAIAKLPDVKDKETFVKKLRELDSVTPK